MRLAGPLTNNAGGAVLLVVSDETEAKTTVANDPAVKSGVFVYEMHPWKLLLGERWRRRRFRCLHSAIVKYGVN
jgi:hypothetical protein